MVGVPIPPAAIRTPRLALVSMSAEFMRALIVGDSTRASEVAGFAVPSEVLIPKWVLESRVRVVEADPSLAPWLIRSIVLVDTAMMIGDIGFHDKPGAQYLREYCDFGVELGYSIYPEYRRHGYAAEALRGMMDWAEAGHGVKEFILSISPSNEPSLRLAASFGFKRVGAHLDDVDEPEDVYLLEH